MGEPQEARALAEARAAARAAKDFARADELRDRLADTGWTVTDEPGGGYRLEPADPEPERADVSVHWVSEGWPEDIDRALAGFRSHAGGRTLRFVVADVTGAAPGRWGPDVEVVSLPQGTGWAAARNEGLRRARSDLIMAVDGSIEPVGDLLTPIVAALEDRAVGVVGPFGIVTTDLREFTRAPGPGPCDAVEGYLMACRREVVERVGGFDEGFRWYRSADIDWSFRVKEAGYRTEVIELPIEMHEHRMWEALAPEERERLSKRNFYRFLDRWRDRWDLVLAGDPASR
jgi:GT2 family glycosyltransferase